MAVLISQSQRRKAPRNLLYATVDSHFPLTQNNPHAKVAYFGGACFEPPQHLQDLVSHYLLALLSA